MERRLLLGQAFERLAAAIDEQYLERVSGYLADPWELRHRYIHVLQGTLTLEDLLDSLHIRLTGKAEQGTIHLLQKAQFQRQRIFTSCGWFFEDFDRIIPRNCVAYAAQAVWLTEKATGVDLSPLAMETLSEVHSWRTSFSTDIVFRSHWKRANRFWKDSD